MSVDGGAAAFLAPVFVVVVETASMIEILFASGFDVMTEIEHVLAKFFV